jgi:hypothetical protein
MLHSFWPALWPFPRPPKPSAADGMTVVFERNFICLNHGTMKSSFKTFHLCNIL